MNIVWDLKTGNSTSTLRESGRITEFVASIDKGSVTIQEKTEASTGQKQTQLAHTDSGITSKYQPRKKREICLSRGCQSIASMIDLEADKTKPSQFHPATVSSSTYPQPLIFSPIFGLQAYVSFDRFWTRPVGTIYTLTSSPQRLLFINKNYVGVVMKRPARKCCFLPLVQVAVVTFFWICSAGLSGPAHKHGPSPDPSPGTSIRRECSFYR